MKVTSNKFVVIDYTLKDKGGKILDSSVGQAPLTYQHGSGVLVEGLENAIEGREKGDKFNVIVQPNEAYGVYQNDLIHDVPKDAFANIEAIEIGSQFEVDVETDQWPQITIGKIVNVTDDTVSFDLNHPLAGEELHFEVEVRDILDAPPVETREQES
ncbi:MAG: peptidylprolyl isomerase [Candidatus Margulisiibacteriota bacterium]